MAAAVAVILAFAVLGLEVISAVRDGIHKA